MSLRFPASRPGRRLPGSSATAQGRRRRMAVESLESRELMTVDLTSSLGFGAPALNANAVVVDGSGNTFVAGNFYGTTNLNPGPGVTNLTSVGTRDAYVAEYSKAGALVWARALPASPGSSAQANSIALDPAGNVVIAGTFSGSANLNPSGPGGLLTSSGGSDAFAAKFSPSGAFAWAARFGSAGDDQANALAADAAGNLLLTGTYTGSVAFGATTLAGSNASAYVAKLGPSGAVQWAQGFSGSSLDYGTRIAVDAAGNAYAGGIYQGTITIGATTLSVAPGVSSAYVAKLSPAGAVGWAVGFGGTANTTAGGLAVDGAGNVLAAGNFKGTSNFGGTSLTSVGTFYNGYAVKLNPSGAGVWAEKFSGTDHVFVNGVGADTQGSIYLGGQFQGTANFNPATGPAVSLTSAGGQDIFASKLDAAGNLVWARQGGGGGNDSTSAIAVTGPDAVSIVGKYTGPAVFGGSVLQAIDSNNMFISRIANYVPPPPPVGGPINFDTTIGVGGPSLDARSIVRDAQGNSFVTGFFRGTVNFNPTGTPTPLTSVGSYDAYVAEYSKAGALVWARALPASPGSSAQANSIALDPAGNVVIAGTFSGSANLNPSGPGGLLTSSGGSDAFAAKFSPSGAFAWAARFGSAGDDQANALAADAAGNLLLTGTYTGSVAFGATTLAGSNASAYVAKLGPSGAVQWAQGFSGSSLDYGTRIAVDAAGNAYAAGLYQGTIRFNSAISLTSAGSTDVYIAKIDPNGNIAWVDGFGGAATDSLGGLDVDGQGNVVGVGTFAGPANFGGISMSPTGPIGSDAFVTKISPTGAVLWAEQLGGELADFGRSVGLDSQGNVYVGGEFTGVGNFDPNGSAAFTSTGSLDVFVAKLDTNGVYQWTLTAGGPSADYLTGLSVIAPNDVSIIGRYAGPAVFGDTALQSIDSTNMYLSHISIPTGPVLTGPTDFLTAASVGGNILDIRAVALDAAGNSYVTGTFNGKVDFDPGAGVSNLTAVGYKDVFLAAYSPSGSLLWAKDLPGVGVNQSQGNGIAVDATGNILLVGSFAGTVNFNPSGAGGSLTAAGGTDIFLAKFSPTGDYSWSKRLGSAGNDQGTGVAVDGSGNVLVTGNYVGAISVGGVSLPSTGSSDVLISKLDPAGNILWTTRFGGLGSDSIARVAVDGAGNIYATGSYTGAALAYTNASGQAKILAGNATLPSVYLLKLNPSGGIVWADGFTGTGNTSAAAVALDGKGNVFITGTVRKATNFGGITVSPFGPATSSAFLAKVNPDGGVSWARAIGGASAALGSDVQVDGDGNVYAGGQFTGKTDFGTVAAPISYNGFGAFDIYVQKFDTDGTPIWARQAGGAGNDYVRALAVHGNNDVTVVGMYSASASFNIKTLTDQVNSSSGYLTRLAQKS